MKLPDKPGFWWVRWIEDGQTRWVVLHVAEADGDGPLMAACPGFDSVHDVSGLDSSTEFVAYLGDAWSGPGAAVAIERQAWLEVAEKATDEARKREAAE